MYLRRLLVTTTRLESSASTRIPTDKMSVNSESSLYPPISRGDGLQRTLILMLFISFLTGSFANFGSLLSFSPNGELCAFTVAWGVLSTETARLMGLFVLLLTLRHLGMKRWELIVSLLWLAVGLVFVFIDAALATGVTQYVTDLSISLCFRRHVLAAAVASTVMYLTLELYIVVRLFSRIPGDPSQRRWAKVFDIRILRALSLVLLNLLTAVPSAIETNTLAATIPYSIGAIGVLLAFGHEVDDWALSNGGGGGSPDVSPSFEPPTPVLPVSARDVQITAPTYSAWVPHHPFSANSLSDPALLVQQPWDEDRQISRTARSTRTIDSTAARSIRDAVIQHARRERLPGTPSQNEPARRTALEDNGVGTQTESTKPRKPELTLNSLRPKLVIVTRPLGLRGFSAEGGETSERRRSLLSSLQLDTTITSRFSSPTVTTNDSRSESTISYPAVARMPGTSGRQILSFSSNREAPSVIVDESSTGSESYDIEDGLAAMEMGQRIVVNPELLAPVASPGGPRSPRAQGPRR